MMLSLVIFILTFCWRWIWIKPSKYVVCQLRKAVNRIHSSDTKYQLQLAQLFNLSSKSEDKQTEILKGLNINQSVPIGLSLRIKLYAGYTSLHFAVQKGDLELTKKLLDLGSNVLKRGVSSMYTPLHIAFNNAYGGKAKLFNIEGPRPESALVNTLLYAQIKNKQFSNPKSLHGSNNDGFSHLNIACIANHIDAVKFLVDKHCVNQSMCSMDKFNKYTSIHFAVKYSAIEAVEILLNHKADIHRQNAKGVSPLHLLINRLLDMHDFVKIGKRARIAPYESEIKRLENIAELFLVNRKLNININHTSNVVWKVSRSPYLYFVDDTGLSALHLACTLPDILPTEYFLKWYNDVNQSVNSNSMFWPGWTPLHFAACCNTETFKLLLGKGADISIKNTNGETALDFFLQRFHLESNPDIINFTLSGIKISDNCSRLSDTLLASSNIDTFNNFLQNMPDVNMNVSLDSPLWPGYTILHLVILMNDKTKTWKKFQKKTDFQQNLNSLPAVYNCTEEEEKIYMTRIELCLEKGCSVTTKNANGQTPLHLAFKMHKANVVEKFLERCHDNETDSEGLSHFHIACATGKIEIVNELVNKGVDINCPAKITLQGYCDSKLMKVKANSTPLHIAVAFKHTEIVSLLLEKGADVYAKDSTDSTPIHLSKKRNLRNIAQLLLEKIPDLQESLDKGKTSHLQVAVYADNEDAVTSLMDNTNSLLPSDKTKLQSIALKYKSNKAYRELLKVSNKNEEINFDSLDVWQPTSWPLIRKLKREKWRDPKAPLNQKSRVTLLHFACAKFDIIWVKKLLKKGADVNAKIRCGTFIGYTPLFRLIDEVAKQTTNTPQNHTNLANLVELLIKKGADVTILSRSETPVHRLSYLLGNRVNPRTHRQAFLLPIFDLMLSSQKNYKVNPTDCNGFSHFHYACARNLVDVVKKFLDHNVDVNRVTYAFAKFNAGFTSLHFATAYRCKEVTDLLLQRGVDINVKNPYGNTPLHMAIVGGSVNISLIESLLSFKPDVSVTNVYDRTPLEFYLLLQNYNSDRLDVLLNHGCLTRFVNTELHFCGILGVAMIRAQPRDRGAIMTKLIEHSGVMKKAIKNGFHAILSLVKAPTERRCTVDDYMDVIEQLIKLGSDIDQKYKDGIKALHGAVYHVNVEAIQALLQLGVDLKLEDCPTIFPSTLSAANMPRFNDIKKFLAAHVWKMNYVGFDESEWNPIFGKEAVDTDLSENNVEESCQSEMAKMEETLITRNLNVKSFLLELKGAVEYPLLPFHRRCLVDEFFNGGCNLPVEFPQLCGLLSYRYKHALARMKLWKPAKEVFVSIIPFFVPDLCVDIILKYLKNDELNVLIELTEETSEPPSHVSIDIPSA